MRLLQGMRSPLRFKPHDWHEPGGVSDSSLLMASLAGSRFPGKGAAALSVGWSFPWGDIRR